MDAVTVNNKLIRSFFTLTFRRIVAIIIFGLTTNLFVQRILPPSQTGIYNIATALLTFFTYFSEFGLAASIIQKKELVAEDLSTTFTIQQAITLTITLILFISAPWVANFYQLPVEGMWLIRALAVGFFLTGLRVLPSVMLERDLRFGPVATVEIVEILTFCLTLIVLLLNNFGINSYSVAVIARSVVGLVLMYIIAPRKLSLGFSKKSAVTLFKFGIPFQLNSLLAMLKDRLVVLVVAKIIGPTGVGLVTWTNNIAFQPLDIMSSMNQVTFPAFSRLQDDVAGLKKTLEQSLFLTGLLMYPMIFGIMSIAPSLVHYVVRHDYTPGLGMIFLYSITALWASLSTPFTNLMTALGKVGLALKLMIMWTILEWLLTPILVYKFGYYGDAYASTIIAFTSIVPIIIIKKIIDVEIIKNIWRPLTASIVMFLAVYLIGQFYVTNWQGVVLQVIIGGSIYCALILVLAKKTITESMNILINRK